MGSGPAAGPESEVPCPPPKQAGEETTLQVAEDDVLGGAQTPSGPGEAPKPPGPAGLALVCGLLILCGLFAAYAGSLLASNPEEGFSAPTGLLPGDEALIDTGADRIWSLVPWTFLGVLALAGSVRWHRKRAFPGGLDRLVSLTYYANIGLLLSAAATFVLIGAVVQYTVASIPVVRVHWFSLPFAYYLSVIAARPGRPWHRVLAAGAFVLWLSMGPALDLPAVSHAKVAYNIAGWTALAFLVPYGLWRSHFPVHGRRGEPAAPAPSGLRDRLSYPAAIMAAPAVLGLLLVVPAIAVPLFTADPQLKEHSGEPVYDGVWPQSGPGNNITIDPDLLHANISLKIINYGGAEATGMFIEFYGYDQNSPRTLVRRVGPISLPAYTIMNETYSVNYSRFIFVDITHDERKIGTATFDFDPDPPAHNEPCAIIMLIPVALMLPFFLKGGRKGGR
jgi:hypothetical protein